jgi:DMSO/TMAO reductase YedYZ molybdopterin-dependent catalytic subunit
MSILTMGGACQGQSSVTSQEIASLPGTIEDVATVAAEAVGAAVPAAALVALAQPEADVRFCTVISADGSYRASIPIDDFVEGGWLAFGLGESPLPEDAGGPLRLTVVRGNTLCWNVKDVGRLRFTSDPEPDDVPAKPKH